jgi:iron-sulfur cluster assembly accessory protein
MNPQRTISLILLAVVTGCADPAVQLDTARTTENHKSTNTTDKQRTLRERSIVKLTDSAESQFKEFLAAEPTKHIRLSVKNEGPTGFIYDLQIDDSINDSDFVDKSHGFMLVVDPKSSIYLDGATIDWQTQSDGQAGFKFDNPNAVER